MTWSLSRRNLNGSCSGLKSDQFVNHNTAAMKLHLLQFQLAAAYPNQNAIF